MGVLILILLSIFSMSCFLAAYLLDSNKAVKRQPTPRDKTTLSTQGTIQGTTAKSLKGLADISYEDIGKYPTWNDYLRYQAFLKECSSSGDTSPPVTLKEWWAMCCNS